MIAFKGTDFSTSGGLSQLATDLANNGGAAWESLAASFQAVLSNIKADQTLAGYQMMRQTGTVSAAAWLKQQPLNMG